MFLSHAASAAAALALATTLAGCGSDAATSTAASLPAAATVSGATPSGWHGTVLDPPLARPAQVLMDTARERVSLAERPAGEISVVFFGFTNCPDICPTAMADLAAARRAMPAELRERVTVYFVTEDPQRDTPGVLRRYLDQFDTSFVGLIGGNAATAAMLKSLYLPETTFAPFPATPAGAQTSPPDEHSGHDGAEHGSGQSPDSYDVNHSGAVYAFGPAGSTVLYSSGAAGPDYADDFTRLLS